MPEAAVIHLVRVIGLGRGLGSGLGLGLGLELGFGLGLGLGLGPPSFTGSRRPAARPCYLVRLGLGF
jgi:hypothetical protein